MSAGKGLALLACCLSLIALVSAEERFRYSDPTKYYVVTENTTPAAPKVVAEFHATRKNAGYYIGGSNNRWALLGCNKNETKCGVWFVNTATETNDVVQTTAPAIDLTPSIANFSAANTKFGITYVQQRLLIRLESGWWLSDCALATLSLLNLNTSFDSAQFVTKRITALVVGNSPKLSNLENNSTYPVDITDKSTQLVSSFGFRTAANSEYYFNPAQSWTIKVVRNAGAANCSNLALTAGATVTDLTTALGLESGYAIRSAAAPQSQTGALSGDFIYVLVTKGDGSQAADKARIIKFNVTNDTVVSAAASADTIPYPASNAKLIVKDTTTMWYRSKENTIVKVAFTQSPITETHTDSVGNAESGSMVFFESTDEIHIYNETTKTIYKTTVSTPGTVTKVAENVTGASVASLKPASALDYPNHQENAQFTCQASDSFTCGVSPPPSMPATQAQAPSAQAATGTVKLSVTAPGNTSNISTAYAKTEIEKELSGFVNASGVTLTIDSIVPASKSFQTLESRMRIQADAVKITFTLSNVPQSELSKVTAKVKAIAQSGKFGNLAINKDSVVEVSITGLPTPPSSPPSSAFSLLSSWKLLSAMVGIALLKMMM